MPALARSMPCAGRVSACAGALQVMQASAHGVHYLGTGLRWSADGMQRSGGRNAVLLDRRPGRQRWPSSQSHSTDLVSPDADFATMFAGSGFFTSQSHRTDLVSSDNRRSSCITTSGPDVAIPLY